MKLLRLLSLCVLCAIFVAGCGDAPKPGDVAPDAAEIADGEVASAGKADVKAVEQAVRDQYPDYDVKAVVFGFDTAENGDDVKVNEHLLDRVCSADKDKQRYVLITLFEPEYLSGRPGEALATTSRKALAMASTGDGKYVYQAYPQELFDRYNKPRKPAEKVSALLRLGCDAAKERNEQYAKARAAAKAGATKAQAKSS
jgi:hypothetical protein